MLQYISTSVTFELLYPAVHFEHILGCVLESDVTWLEIYPDHIAPRSRTLGSPLVCAPTHHCEAATMAYPRQVKPLRNAKACETCRMRKVRCYGGRPCEPCATIGNDECIVRAKPRHRG